jgi:thiosulfate dehydrogenase (quinone) large subunit
MQRTIKLYLRLAIAAGFLSAVADRLGFWSEEMSIWGNWESFLVYTQLLNPWISAGWIPAIGFIATAAEVAFALFLLVGFKTELFAVLSGVLLLLFALSMIFSTSIKGVFDFSVLTASAAAFALATMREKSWELDNLLFKG